MDNRLPELDGFTRPRLRDDMPLMWRTSTSISIGDDVVLEGVTRSHVAWLTSLDGLRTGAQIEADLDLPVREARRLLRALVAAAALDDASRTPNAVRWARPEQRDEEVARFAATVRTCRSLDLAYEVSERREKCRVAVRGHGPLADGVRAMVVGSGLCLVEGSGPAGITVLADAPHPDVPAFAERMRMSGAHLHVGVLGDRGCVGPLVVPGITGCLECAHLHHRDADPAWPVLAVQWAQAVRAMRQPPMDPVLAQLVAIQATLLVRAWADEPDHYERWAGFALDVRLPDGAIERRERPPHPLCGCRWQAA